MNSFPWSFFPVLFIGMWIGIALFLSRLGWSDLASSYRAETRFEGRRWHWVSAYVGKVSYRSSLTMGANGDGLFMVPVIFFRIAHPPLFVPWSDITAIWKQSFLFPYVQLTTRWAPDAAILIAEPQARAMALKAGAAWPAPDLLAQIELRRATVDRWWTAAAYAAVAVVVFSVAAIGLGSFNVGEYWKLDRTSESVGARVTSVEPEHHSSLRYTYKVRGAWYEGFGSITDAGSAPIAPGDPLTIHFVPAEPAISCLGDPHALLVNEVMFAGLSATFLTIVALFSFRSLGFAIRRPKAKEVLVEASRN